MKRIPLILVFFLICIQSVSAQSVRTGKGNAKGQAFKYHYLEPAGTKKGIVILLPGSGEKFRNILTNVSLAGLLFKHGFVVIVPEVHTLLYADDYSINVLDELLKVKVEEYSTKSLIVGGFSSGGAIATRYVEYLISRNSKIDIKGLFVVDPPLDLQRVHKAGKRMLEKCEGLIKRDGLNITTQLENAFGGSPDQQHQQYIDHSSFTASDAEGGNAKFLKSLSIRLYSEPDLNFVKKNYCNELEKNDINAADLEALYEFLVRRGNSRCEYITTSGRGFHSWNIIEPNSCIEWILKISS